VASVRIYCHLREGGGPISLAEVGDVCQGSFDFPDLHQENVRVWSKVTLNAPGPPRGVVVPAVHLRLVHSDPFLSTLFEILPKMWTRVDQGGPGGPGGP